MHHYSQIVFFFFLNITYVYAHIHAGALKGQKAVWLPISNNFTIIVSRDNDFIAKEVCLSHSAEMLFRTNQQRNTLKPAFSFLSFFSSLSLLKV